MPASLGRWRRGEGWAGELDAALLKLMTLRPPLSDLSSKGAHGNDWVFWIRDSAAIATMNNGHVLSKGDKRQLLVSVSKEETRRRPKQCPSDGALLCGSNHQDSLSFLQVLRCRHQGHRSVYQRERWRGYIHGLSMREGLCPCSRPCRFARTCKSLTRFCFLPPGRTARTLHRHRNIPPPRMSSTHSLPGLILDDIIQDILSLQCRVARATTSLLPPPPPL